MPKKTGIFQHPFCRKTPLKLKEGPLGENFWKKSFAMPKKLEGGTLWSRSVSYVTREPFWFSSLNQQVQFGVFLKFCRTFGGTILGPSEVSKKITDEKPRRL